MKRMLSIVLGLMMFTGFVRPVFVGGIRPLNYAKVHQSKGYSPLAAIGISDKTVYAADKNIEILEVIGIVEEAPRLDSGQATESAEATSSGTIKLEEAKKEDITERESPVKSKLEGYLADKDPGTLSWRNFLQWGIRQAVDQGVSPNTIVLVLLFPLVAGLIAAARHLFGLTGFGIFVPAMLSVAMVATGSLGSV